MKIAVLGSGSIGGTIGKKWLAAGHQVIFGSRSPNKHDLAQLGAGAQAGSISEAIAFGEVVLFAIPGRAMDETIKQHAAELHGKIVIDATNQMGTPVMNSLAAFKAHAPTALVYRAFANLGWENFQNPHFGATQADLFFSGPSGDGQAKLERLIADVGLRPVWLGGPEQTPLVDSLTSLWFALALNQGRGRHLAFKMLND